MLNIETKRRIDSARDVLVGKVPDPKAQVEQITTAMVYKFMDDMDKEAQEVGGKAKFFTNGFEKYSWTNIMDPKLGGQERLNIYAEAIVKMQNNPHIPQLFRDIFKDAFLPYRSPETLNLFLKEINGFKYLHSEDLGDAFEYLLSVMGSQGDAGQFRTPRHIIDFIVSVVDPKKDETILDPACGTAGFLISSYKHIVSSNKNKLSPEDKKKMMNRIVGYDISPDMVKLSKVNMYLHGFLTPHIYEYDTLSSEERWEETYDVIMANPPFMTPKGGIKPHKRFSVQANRAEVLFVNYIIEHLNVNGRAGIIVPEGIIFQSANAYKQLRKILIEENYLYAVASLPPGVFNPYAGVKTSILFLDKDVAKKVKHIMFLKINNDGYELGAQRRLTSGSELPMATDALKAYINHINNEGSVSKTGWPNLPEVDTSPICTFISKEKIINSGSWNLTGERYIDISFNKNQRWPMIPLIETCEILDSKRKPVNKSQRKKGIYPYYGATGVVDYVDHFLFDEKLVLIGEDGAKWGKGEKTAFIAEGKYWVNNHAHVLRTKKDKIIDELLVEILNSMDLRPYVTGITVPKLNQENLKSIKIPLPPLEVQKEIVEEIEVKRKAIEAAKEVIINLKRERQYFGKEAIKLNNIEWVQLKEVCDLQNGFAFKSTDYVKLSNTLNIRMSNIRPDSGFDAAYNPRYLPDNYADKYKDYELNDGDIIIAMTDMANDPKILGVPTIVRKKTNKKFLLNQRVGKLFNFDLSKVFIPYLKYILANNDSRNYYKGFGSGGLQVNIGKNDILSIKIPLPTIETQKMLVKTMEEQEEIIESNKKLIAIFQNKIKEIINNI